MSSAYMIILTQTDLHVYTSPFVLVLSCMQMTLFCCRHLLQLYKNCYMSAKEYFKTSASFYRAFNAVFGKIGRSSSEEVVLQLINSKCSLCRVYCMHLKLVQLIKRKKNHWNLL